MRAGFAAGKPLVVDADALNLLAPSPRAMPQAVLTPHPGEAARLLACANADVQRDRIAAATRIAERFDAVVVLKGAGSVIAAPKRVPRIVGAGNPGMAVAGMGDVLTGVVAACARRGLDAFDAASAGVCCMPSPATSRRAMANAGCRRATSSRTAPRRESRKIRACTWLTKPRPLHSRTRSNARARAGRWCSCMANSARANPSLARAWLRACGVEGAIRSPTYTLVEHYPLAAGGNALHLDLYRIGAAGELEFLALDSDDAELGWSNGPNAGPGAARAGPELAAGAGRRRPFRDPGSRHPGRRGLALAATGRQWLGAVSCCQLKERSYRPRIHKENLLQSAPADA